MRSVGKFLALIFAALIGIHLFLVSFFGINLWETALNKVFGPKPAVATNDPAPSQPPANINPAANPAPAAATTQPQVIVQDKDESLGKLWLEGYPSGPFKVHRIMEGSLFKTFSTGAAYVVNLDGDDYSDVIIGVVGSDGNIYLYVFASDLITVSDEQIVDLSRNTTRVMTTKGAPPKKTSSTPAAASNNNAATGGRSGSQNIGTVTSDDVLRTAKTLGDYVSDAASKVSQALGGDPFDSNNPDTPHYLKEVDTANKRITYRVVQKVQNGDGYIIHVNVYNAYYDLREEWVKTGSPLEQATYGPYPRVSVYRGYFKFK